MANSYTTSDTITFDSGLKYSHVCHAGVAEFTVGADATVRPGRDGDCWSWTEKFAGGTMNVQAYGPDAKPGATGNYNVEVREKQLPADKGGYKFLFLKLTPAEAAVDSNVVVVTGAYLRKVEDLANAAITTIWCPQQKHDGGIAIASINVPLPAERPKSHMVSRNKTSA
jgi:hypothetical protein